MVQLWTLPVSKTLAHASSFRCFKAGDKMDISHFDYGSSKSGHPYGDPDTWQAGFSLLDAEKSEGLISFFNIETSLLFVRFSKCQQTFLLKKIKDPRYPHHCLTPKNEKVTNSESQYTCIFYWESAFCCCVTVHVSLLLYMTAKWSLPEENACELTFWVCNFFVFWS